MRALPFDGPKPGGVAGVEEGVEEVEEVEEVSLSISIHLIC